MQLSPVVCAIGTCIEGELHPCSCHLYCVPFRPVHVLKANFNHVVVTFTVFHLDMCWLYFIHAVVTFTVFHLNMCWLYFTA